MASDLIQRLRDRAKFNTAVSPYNLLLDAAEELESAEKAEELMREHIAAQDRRIAELEAALEQAKKRMRNCRGAIESNQVVDKDVHGSLTNGMADIDAAIRALIPEQKEG